MSKMTWVTCPLGGTVPEKSAIALWVLNFTASMQRNADLRKKRKLTNYSVSEPDRRLERGQRVP